LDILVAFMVFNQAKRLEKLERLFVLAGTCGADAVGAVKWEE
jgi:hypothetical protein